MDKLPLIWAATALAAVFAMPGCDSPGGNLYQRLQHEDPSVRIEAMRQAAEAKDMAAAPYIVEQLNDSDADVRMFAIISLEKITGRRLGYQHYAPAAQRDEAIERWRQWLREHASTTQPVPDGQQ
ncbi:MAG: HEAT repeat domain-containing protein [Phycisphaerae bacterium]